MEKSIQFPQTKDLYNGNKQTAYDIIDFNFKLYSKTLEEKSKLLQKEKEIYQKLIKISSKIPTTRIKAYPNGTEEDKLTLKQLVEENSKLRKEEHKIEKEKEKLSKKLSSIRYHNFVINKILKLTLSQQTKEKTFCSLYYNEEEKGFYVTIYNKEKGNETIFFGKEAEYKKLNQLIKSMELVCIFEEYDKKNKHYIENIEELKNINLKTSGEEQENDKKSKFISIQHLTRHYTDFELLSIDKIIKMVGLEKNNIKKDSTISLNIFLAITLGQSNQ